MYFSNLTRFVGGCLVSAVLLTVGTRTEAAVGKPTALEIRGEFASVTGEKQEVLKLRGQDARQQILVTGTTASGQLQDFTRVVTYKSEPPGIVQVLTNGLVIGLADGQSTLTATGESGLTAQITVHVHESKTTQPVNFPNDVVPIFTKGGCNGGGCHGKSDGQNGFRLSLLGFEPAEDYEYLVKEARGRRLFPAAPDRSLLLLKGAALLPHGGGKRLDPDTPDYRLLVRWMSQGMPYGKTNDPTVIQIEVFPKERSLFFGAEQQLVVMARYSDGTSADVTRSTLFEANDKNLAKTDANGLVTLSDQPGDVAVMVRYQSKVAVARLIAPLGAPVEHLPVARNFIDEIVFKKLKAVGMPPSEISDDTTFFRRSTLDIAGRLPTPEEAEKFLASKDPKRRDLWIDSLLASSDYADFFANKWSALLRNKRGTGTHTRGTFAFHSWIRDSLAENKPYDQFVRQVVSASGDLAENPPVAWFRQVRSSSSQLEDTAQLFLGQRLQCAQCHHHPYEKWSQDDYFSLAAVFNQTGRKGGSQPGEEVIFHQGGFASATNKRTKQDVKPAALGTKLNQVTSDEDPRAALADWFSSKTNPFFAKSLVNRYWKHFFGRGLVDPEDDMRETNPPSNPELLDALAQNFIASGFDMKQLIRTIAQSTVYQLSSIPNQYNAGDKQYFSRYYPKRHQAEVLFDSVNLVLKTDSKFSGLPTGTRAVQLPDNSFNSSSYFLSVFGRPESNSSCECERSQEVSLAQCLHLLNSKEIQERLTADDGRPASLANDTKTSNPLKLRQLYMLAFSREPSTNEIQFAQSYLDKKGDQQKKTAYEDIVWAVLNTKEFLFNH